MLDFLKLNIDNFCTIQNAFLQDRINIVYTEQSASGTDNIDSMLQDDNIQFKSSIESPPYSIAESAHPNKPPRAFLGEPCFVNPCSYNSVDTVLRHIQTQSLDDSKPWTVVGCDGLPYVLGARLIESDATLQNLLLVPGLGHFEMNMTRAIFKLLWDVVIEDLADLLGFRTIRAKESCKNCSDHHKSFQIVQILLFGTMDEIIVPYARKCISNSQQPTLPGFIQFIQSSNDPNYRFLTSVICTYVLALYIFRCGVRKNNQRFILAGRCKFSELFFGLNMTTYQEIDFRDTKMRTILPDDLSMFMQTNEAFSLSGSLFHGEGGDFVLESFNRKIKRLLPPGLPSDKDWTRVCRNVTDLDEVTAPSVPFICIFFFFHSAYIYI